MEAIPSSGSPQEATRGELCGTAAAEGGEIPFAKGKGLVRLNCEDAEGLWEAPETDGNTKLVPLNPVPLSAVTSSSPAVIRETMLPGSRSC